MKSLCLRICLCMGLLSCFACKSGTNKEGQSSDALLKTVEEQGAQMNRGTGTFSISAPDGWSRVDTVDHGIEVTFISSAPENDNDDFLENVNVVTEDARDYKLDEYFERSIELLERDLPGFFKMAPEDRVVNGLTAKQIKYSCLVDSRPLSMQAVFFVKNKIAYIITCTAKKGESLRWEGFFDDIVSSFKII